MTGMRKIVIILDVNSIPRVQKPGNSQNETEEKEEEAEAMEFDKEAVKAVKESVVLLLCREAMKLNSTKEFRKFDFSKVEWTFKLFNSSIEIHSKTGKKFSPLNNASVENFEANLDAAVQADGVSAVKSLPEANSIKLLSTALMSVLSDLRWIDVQSCGLGKNGASGNSIYSFFRVPRNDSEFGVFTSNCSVVFQPKDVLNELIPRAFLKKMRDDKIQLNLVDMWNLHVNSGIQADSEPWDGIQYEKSMKKIVHALSHGTIEPFCRKLEQPSYGMPSYSNLLKLVMASGSPSPKSKGCPDGTKIMNSSFESKMNTSINQETSNISPEYVASSRQGSSTQQRLDVTRSRPSLNKLRESHLDLNVYESRVAMEGQMRKKKQTLRYSDEYLLFAKEASRKRKICDDDYEEEEEYVRVPSGYSKRDINSWYESITNKPSPEERRQRVKYCSGRRKSVGSISKFAMLQEHGRVRERRHATEDCSRMSKYSPSVCDSSLMRKYKRSRGQDDELIMAPPSRISTLKQLRHSAPNSFPDPRMSSSFAGSNGSSSFSRGRMMVAEGMRKVSVTRNQGTENAEMTDEEQEELLQKQYEAKLRQRKIEFNSLKTRFELKLSEIQPKDIVQDEMFDLLDTKVNRFREVSMVDGTNLLCLAQVLVSILTKSLGEWKVTNTQATLENILLIPSEKLNMDLLRSMSMGVEAEEDAFCQFELQVLLNLEIALSISEDADNEKSQELLDETIKLLNLTKMYRKDPPVEEFVTKTLLPEYQNTLPRFLKEIMFTLNIQPPDDILMCSPGPKDSDYRDDCSVSSASSSIMSSVSTRNERHHAQRRSQDSLSLSFASASQESQRGLKKGFSFIQANNPRRSIMIPASKPKDGKSKLEFSRTSGPRSSALLRPSPKPKKVRRNLFDVSATDSKDMKHLVSLATNSNSFTRSPSLFKSPSLSSRKSGFSPRSPARVSPYFKAVRSRNRKCLNLDNEPNNSTFGDQSPGMSGIVVPESPVTPQSKGKVSNFGSDGACGSSVVQESPEIDKAVDYTSSQNLSRRVNSVSFYSSGTDSLKAKAWEISGNKLTAARIKDSVDTSMGLNLSDLEMFPFGFSPKTKFQRAGTEADSSTDVVEYEKVTHSFEHRPTVSPIPSTSKAVDCGGSNINQVEIVNAKPGELKSTTIEALINCENFPPASVILAAVNTPLATIASPAKNIPIMDTPSKKVVFNLDENLVNTPSPKNTITGTPKSILKDSSITGLLDPSQEAIAQ